MKLCSDKVKKKFSSALLALLYLHVAVFSLCKLANELSAQMSAVGNVCTDLCVQSMFVCVTFWPDTQILDHALHYVNASLFIFLLTQTYICLKFHRQQQICICSHLLTTLLICRQMCI